MGVRISQRAVFVIALSIFAVIGVVGFLLSPSQFGLLNFARGIGKAPDPTIDRGHKKITTIYIKVKDESLPLILSDNSAATKFAAQLVYGDLRVVMDDDHSSKAGTLDFKLPIEAENIVMKPGDVILHQDNQLAIYYDTFSKSSTQIGRIQDATQGKLKSLFGKGAIEVTFSLDE